MKKITVLFTACCGWPTCGTIDALRKSEEYEFECIGVDCSPIDACLNYVDYLYKVPKCTEPDYCSSLLEICEKHDVKCIVPLISDEIGVLNENREMFESKGISFLMSGKESMLDIANNKYLLKEFLLKNGIDIMPKSILITEDNLDEALEELGYPEKPVCFKCTNGCGASGFKIISDDLAVKNVFSMSRSSRANPYITKEHLKASMKYFKPNFMLQEYIEGEEESTLCLVNHGRTIYSPTHKNETMQYATATNCVLVNDEEANEIVRKINELFKFDGNIGYDFKRRADGSLVLLEINPRISATVSLAMKAGLNLIELGVLQAIGEKIDEHIIPTYGVKLMRNYGTLYSFHGKAYGRN